MEGVLLQPLEVLGRRDAIASVCDAHPTRLADATVAVMRNHNLTLMANHGQVTVARDFDHAIQNAEFFELACQIIIEGGDKVTPLSEEAARELMDLGQKAACAAV